MLRVGELAKKSGLTVRTLHHYDSIGLLRPSARSDSGYRLYGPQDIARLHQIQALRQFGLPLTEIGALLARTDVTLATVIAQQIEMLDRKIARFIDLRERLTLLQAQHSAGEAPDLADWLNTLELMTMYEKYFSPEELKALPFYSASPEDKQEWKAMVEEAHTLITQGVPPEDARAQDLATRWMLRLERDTAAHPVLFAKLNTMHANERGLQEQSGITPATIDYIVRAFSQAKLAIYEKYLSPEEFAFLSANYFKRMHEWPPLIAELREAMAGGVAPEDDSVQALAQRWMALFCSYAGNDPATHQKIRDAMGREPGLRRGTWVDEPLLDYLRRAMAGMQRR